MRKSHLTAGLGVAALVAALVAPRLQGWVAPETAEIDIVPMQVPPEQIVTAVEAQIESPPESVVEAAPVPVALPSPVRPRPPGPDGAIEMKTGHAPDTLIPELDQPVIRHPIVHAQPPPPEPIDVDFWDDCPACGMG